MKFYGYKTCSTCRKAQKALDAAGIDYENIDITTEPPSVAELRSILSAGSYELGQLFNRSGVAYRELDMKSTLPTLSEDEALAVLASNGRLVKRPIAIEGDRATVGYREDLYSEVWGA